MSDSNTKYSFPWSENLKQCPGCNVPIFKSGGCQWFRCIMCNTHFCWFCMQITDDHKHKPGQVCNALHF